MARAIIETGRSGKSGISKGWRKMTGKGNFYQAEGFMKQYIPKGPEAQKAVAILNIPRKKSIAHENAFDQLGGTLTKIFGAASKGIWGTPGANAATEILLKIADKYVPVVRQFVTKLKTKGLQAAELTEMKLLFQNSMADAILEEYQAAQEKLPEEERRPITSDDIADLFASHKDFATWLKSDVTGVQSKERLPHTEDVIQAVNALERRDSKSPATLKELQNDSLETIKKLHSMGLLDTDKLFNWLKSSV